MHRRWPARTQTQMQAIIMRHTRSTNQGKIEVVDPGWPLSGMENLDEAVDAFILGNILSNDARANVNAALALSTLSFDYPRAVVLKGLSTLHV